MKNDFFKRAEGLPESNIDLSRLDPEINTKVFFESLKALQVPCPWGDLKKGEGLQKFHGMPELDRIPNLPLGLVVGCGHFPQTNAYQSVASVDKFGKLIYSDVFNPRMGPRDYVVLDLTKPETINLFGYKVHAIMSVGVFTYDSHGVQFMDKENETKAAKALNDMLMPGGIIANDNLDTLSSGRFERIFLDKFGFELVRDTNSIIIQKPF